ncbi:hypothetical protein FKM82_013454 [Ascaphus truei]
MDQMPHQHSGCTGNQAMSCSITSLKLYEKHPDMPWSFHLSHGPDSYTPLPYSLVQMRMQLQYVEIKNQPSAKAKMA